MIILTNFWIRSLPKSGGVCLKHSKKFFFCSKAQLFGKICNFSCFSRTKGFKASFLEAGEVLALLLLLVVSGDDEYRGQTTKKINTNIKKTSKIVMVCMKNNSFFEQN